MNYYKVCVSMALVICLVFCPLCIRVNANPVITSWVIGAFLAVAISMGFYFDINLADISTWVTAKIEAYLQANGYNSIEAWLGANFEAEASISGSYLGITPNLYAKLKLAVEFAMGSGNDELPSGGTVSDPVEKTILGGWYFPSLIVNGVTYSDFQIMDIRSEIGASANSPVGHLKYHSTGIPTSYILYTIDNPIPTVGITYTFESNQQVISYYRNDNSSSSSYPIIKNSSELAKEQNVNRYTQQSDFTMVSSNTSTWGQLVRDTNYPVYLTFGVIDNTRAYPLLVYRTVSGIWIYTFNSNFNNFQSLLPFGGSTQIDAFSVGQPSYNFNNADLIYIDLQLGQLNSTLQAILDLIAAINNNLISWTIAIQTNTPSDLPENTTQLIDYVDYCNGQTNLYLSGTSSLSACVGNMYSELYNTLTEVSSSQISTALINTYNGFINKLTLFSSLSDPGGSLTSVQAFQDALSALTGTYNQKITNATSLLDTYISNASGLQEIIALYNAFTSYCESLGFQINLVTDTKSSISQMNGVVDQFIAGNITSDQALTSLLALYKNGISGSKTADQVGAIVSAYQACVDRVTLLGLEIDPDGLGEVSADVINLEDDLLSNIDLNEISSFLSFQNWTYINASEGSLYREFFQKIMNSDSPFYLYIYVPLILGIVSIILGTRVHLPSRKENHSGPH